MGIVIVIVIGPTVTVVVDDENVEAELLSSTRRPFEDIDISIVINIKRDDNIGSYYSINNNTYKIKIIDIATHIRTLQILHPTQSTTIPTKHVCH
jgi:hypothetical protein